MATPLDQLQYSIVKNEEVTPELDQAIRDGLVECFPHNAVPYSKKRAWHSDPAWIVVAQDSDGTVAGYMAAVERTVLVGSDTVPVRIAGLQGVFARKQWRKTGLTGRLMDSVVRRGPETGHRSGTPVLPACAGRQAVQQIRLEEGGRRNPAR